jgi:hypothetical protein
MEKKHLAKQCGQDNIGFVKEKVGNELFKDEFLRNDQYYLFREKALMVDKYGKTMYEWNQDNEAKYLIPSDFLKKHGLSPEARERMVDWMIEVFSVNKSEPGTFELAVHIMDSYILNTNKILKDEDIHLIGLTSIYIASKMEEKIPMRLIHIVNNLGKGVFSKAEIITMEKEIVETIEFDFFTAGTYDYLMTFFWDLKVNNGQILNDFKEHDVIDKYMKFCIFLSKLTLYNHKFAAYSTSLIAVGILTLGFDFLKRNNQIKEKKLMKFLQDWIFYLMNEMKFNPDAVGYVYLKIYDLYKLDILERIKDNDESSDINSDDVPNLFKLYTDYMF